MGYDILANFMKFTRISEEYSKQIIADEDKSHPVWHVLSGTGYDKAERDELIRRLLGGTDQVVLTIDVSDYQDAVVKINGILQSNITVDINTEVSYTITAPGFKELNATEIVDSTKTIKPTLEEDLVTLTFDTNGYSNSVIVANKQHLKQNSVQVRRGSTVKYEAVAPGYDAVSDSVIVNDTMSVKLHLEHTREKVTPVIVICTPAADKLVLTEVGRETNRVEGNIISINYGATIQYEATKVGYKYATGTTTAFALPGVVGIAVISLEELPPEAGTAPANGALHLHPVDTPPIVIEPIPNTNEPTVDPNTPKQ